MVAQKTEKLSRIRRYIHKHGIIKVAQEVAHSKYKGVLIYKFKVDDGYHQPWYWLERLGSRLLAGRLETYLAKRQHMHFEHPRNAARRLLYALPSFAEWATLMPGALALEPIHHPEQKRLFTGKTLDPITRRLFRHGLDPVGVRTRTLMGGWLAYQYVINRPNSLVRWISLAGGTAAPSMLMVSASGVDKKRLRYADIDIDARAIEIAQEITAFEELPPASTKLLTGDIFDPALIAQVSDPLEADIVELMGIFEYLDEKQAVRLLKMAYKLLKKDGIIIASNMRAEHPQLNLHKRGVGWPDVIPRSVGELVALSQKAGISSAGLSIYQPLDGVYNVFQMRKM